MYECDSCTYDTISSDAAMRHELGTPGHHMFWFDDDEEDRR